MKTIGSHPGAINFRLSMMVILILVLIYVFLDYAETAERATEVQSIEQTRRIINSALAVSFSTYATNGDLQGLNQLDGGNPFVLLNEYLLLPASYHGETQATDPGTLSSGWHFQVNTGQILYIAFYIEEIHVFRIDLNYVDNNQNVRFDPDQDRFNHLGLERKQPL